MVLFSLFCADVTPTTQYDSRQMNIDAAPSHSTISRPASILTRNIREVHISFVRSLVRIARPRSLQALAQRYMTAPTLSYVICTAPRAGSTLLTEFLTGTNIAGKPAEYFDIHDHNEKYWTQKLGIQHDSEYFDRVVDTATTSNGVFGVKLLWHQSPAIIAKLAHSLHRESGGDDSLHHLLRQKLGDVRYIWLRRQNKVAQAISYYRASRTGLWRSSDARTEQRARADVELPFNYALIDQNLRLVNEFDLRWHDYFHRHRLKALMIFYEHFAVNAEQTIQKINEFLGISHGGIVIRPPRLERQSDQRSLEWEQRFLKMRNTATSQSAARLDRSQSGESSDDLRRRTKAKGKWPSDAPLPMTAFAVSPRPPEIVTATARRDWMDATPKRYAYRCLPMVIANQAGWLILNRSKLTVTWNGTADQSGLRINFEAGKNPQHAVSLFGCGILTFTIGYLFRTPPGYNLYVHGPANMPKDGICPLEGIVETDWPESTFTMNWKVTRPDHPIVFESNEPIAMVTPMPRYQLERFEPEIRNISDVPQLEARYEEWLRSRQKHNVEIRIPNSKAQREGWQRHYMRGTTLRSEIAEDHQTSLSLKSFIDKRR
jgi:LPS sulfotransferase NodH